MSSFRCKWFKHTIFYCTFNCIVFHYNSCFSYIVQSHYCMLLIFYSMILYHDNHNSCSYHTGISHICQYAPHRPTVVWITQLTFSLQNKSLPQIVLADVLLFWDKFIKYYSANISNAPIIKTSEQISLKIYFYLVVGG